MVGDSLEADVAGAKAAGMMSVWVNRERLSLPAAGPRPGWTVTTLAEARSIVEHDSA